MVGAELRVMGGRHEVRIRVGGQKEEENKRKEWEEKGKRGKKEGKEKNL